MHASYLIRISGYYEQSGRSPGVIINESLTCIESEVICLSALLFLLVMKQKIEDHSSEINEKCSDLLKTQTTLKSLEVEFEFTKTSLQSENNRNGEETRSLNKRLISTQKQNDSLLKNNSKLSEQMVQLKNEITKNNAILHDKNHVLLIKDKTLSELENETREHKTTISNLREQATRLFLL